MPCDVAPCGALQCSAMCCGAVWCSVMYCGAVSCNVVQWGHHVLWHGVVLCDAVPCTVLQCGTVAVSQTWSSGQRGLVFEGNGDGVTLIQRHTVMGKQARHQLGCPPHRQMHLLLKRSYHPGNTHTQATLHHAKPCDTYIHTGHIAPC